MADCKCIWGFMSLEIGGQVVEAYGEFTYDARDFESEVAATQSGGVREKQTPRLRRLEGEIYWDCELDLDAIKNFCGPVVLIAQSGQVIAFEDGRVRLSGGGNMSQGNQPIFVSGEDVENFKIAA